MPVESEQAQAPQPATAQPLDSGGTPAAARPPVGAPRPAHDEHELPDGRYLIAYRSASNA